MHIVRNSGSVFMGAGSWEGSRSKDKRLSDIVC